MSSEVQGDILTAYRTLRSHVEALQQQWQEVDLLQELDRFETEYLEEQTAKELGVAGAFALGLTVLHQTVKALLPAKVATPVVGGAWMLGGAYIVFRLTAGTVGGWIGVMERNARRKKNLRRKLEDLEDRLRVMLDTQAVLMGCQPTRGVPEEARGQASRAHSAGSSAELVEAPSTEGEGSPEGSAAGAMSPPTEEMEGWHRYATLARRKQGGGG